MKGPLFSRTLGPCGRDVLWPFPTILHFGRLTLDGHRGAKVRTTARSFGAGGGDRRDWEVLAGAGKKGVDLRVLEKLWCSVSDSLFSPSFFRFC